MTRPTLEDRQRELLSALVATGSLRAAAHRVGIRYGSAKVYLSRLHVQTGLSTPQLIWLGITEGWLLVEDVERAG